MAPTATRPDSASPPLWRAPARFPARPGHTPEPSDQATCSFRGTSPRRGCGSHRKRDALRKSTALVMREVMETKVATVRAETLRAIRRAFGRSELQPRGSGTRASVRPSWRSRSCARARTILVVGSHDAGGRTGLLDGSVNHQSTYQAPCGRHRVAPRIRRAAVVAWRASRRSQRSRRRPMPRQSPSWASRARRNRVAPG
jgi:hypothetical protein